MQQQHLLFEDGGRVVDERRVEMLPVVEDFEPLEVRRTRRRMCDLLSTMDKVG